MSRNGIGVYTLPSGINPVIPDTDITADWWNTTSGDLAAAVTASIANDGQSPILANLPMSNFKHINVGNASARNQYAAAGQIQDNTLTYGGVAGGSADALTISLSPGLPAYVAGQRFAFISGASANTTTTPTLTVNGLVSKTFKRADGTAIQTGDIKATTVYEALYDGTNMLLVSNGINGITSTGNVQTFTTSGAGTWTKPAGISTVIMTLVAGGAGAGSGGVMSFGGAPIGGGGGGQGGGYGTMTLPASLLGATESVFVGAGGIGGSGAGLSSGDSGNDGTDGGDSYFGDFLIVYGGAKGLGGLASVGTGGTTNGGGFPNLVGATTGGAGGDGGYDAGFAIEPGVAGFPASIAGGGGAGGGNSSSVSPYGGIGGIGGHVGSIASNIGGYKLRNVGGTAGAVQTSDGGNGNSSSAGTPIGGSGGGGGAGSGGGVGDATNGGDGGLYGGGGGGGGAGAGTGGFGASFVAGNGGNGADGIIVVMCF